MRLKQWGAVLMGCAALLLTACTVVDLDENGKPVLPADPNAKPSFDHLTPQQIAQQTRQSRVIDAANQHALDATALEKVRQASGATPQSVFVRLSSEVTGIDVSNPREQSSLLRYTASRWSCSWVLSCGATPFAMPAVLNLKTLPTSAVCAAFTRLQPGGNKIVADSGRELDRQAYRYSLCGHGG